MILLLCDDLLFASRITGPEEPALALLEEWR